MKDINNIVDDVANKLAVDIIKSDNRDVERLRKIIGNWRLNYDEERKNAVIVQAEILQTSEGYREDIKKLSTAVEDPTQTSEEGIIWIKTDETSDEEPSDEEPSVVGLKDSLENFRSQVREYPAQKEPQVPARDSPTIDEDILELDAFLKDALANVDDIAKQIQDLTKK